MKILLINVVYGHGSTGVIVKNLYEFYKNRGDDVYALFGRGKNTYNDDNIFKCSSEFESKVCHFISLFNGNLYGGMHFSTKKIIKKIKQIQPDVVHLHCINGFFVNLYDLLTFLKKEKIKTVLTNHAEFMLSANCGYTLSCEKWKTDECKNCKRVSEFVGKYSLNKTNKYYLKLKESLKDFNNLSITCVSPWLEDKFKCSNLYRGKCISTILNPVCLKTSGALTNPYSIALKNKGKKKVALFICTQLDNPEKGFGHFLELAKTMKESDYLFALVGANSPEIVESENIISFGKIDNSMLSSFYKFADLTLLLSKCETFSMVVAESLCCGTPVVGFFSGGPETIAIPKYSYFFRNGDLKSLSIFLQGNNLSNSSKTRQELSTIAIKKYSLETIGNQFLEVYKR